jgi:hypothetical protein
MVEDKYIREFGDEYVKQLAASLRKAGKGSGNLIKSLQPKLKAQAESIQVIIEAEDYLEYVDAGRKPGSFPNISALQSWAKKKGINQKAVFPIAKSIYKFGIKPTNVIDESMRNFERIGLEIIEEGTKDAVEEAIVKEFNKIDNIDE